MTTDDRKRQDRSGTPQEDLSSAGTAETGFDGGKPINPGSTLDLETGFTQTSFSPDEDTSRDLADNENREAAENG